jgi:hypothetical protein
MNREKECFENQSREMRENYQKIKEGSGIGRNYFSFFFKQS